MRGPGVRLDNDVRRIWTCPACQKQRRLSGDVTSPLCFCRADGVQMQLTADSKLLRRAERLTPLPYIKKPLPEGWHIPLPIEEQIPPESPRPPKESQPPEEPVAQTFLSESAQTEMSVPPLPEPKAESNVADDFGADLNLPPEPLGESPSA